MFPGKCLFCMVFFKCRDYRYIYLKLPDLARFSCLWHSDKWWHPAFFAYWRESQSSTGSHGVDYLAAPWPRSIRTTSLCLFFVWCCEAGRILAQPVDFHCELFMVSLNGALMKNGDHFRPHCSCWILLLGTTFIKKAFFNVLWPRLIFVPISMRIWENVSVFFQDTKQTVYSRYYFIQTALHFDCIAVRSSESLYVLAVFWSDLPQGRLETKHLHSSHTILQLSVPHCINPCNLSCVCPIIRLSSVLPEAFCLSTEKTPRRMNNRPCMYTSMYIHAGTHRNMGTWQATSLMQPHRTRPHPMSSTAHT